MIKPKLKKAVINGISAGILICLFFFSFILLIYIVSWNELRLEIRVWGEISNLLYVRFIAVPNL